MLSAYNHGDGKGWGLSKNNMYSFQHIESFGVNAGLVFFSNFDSFDL